MSLTSAPKPGLPVRLGGRWNGSEGVVVLLHAKSQVVVELTLSGRDDFRKGDRIAVDIGEIRAIGVRGKVADETLDERDVKLTEGQISILLSITGPRLADPYAVRCNDWSVDLHRRLLEALPPNPPPLT